LVDFLAPIPNWLGALILVAFAVGAAALSGRRRSEGPAEERSADDREEQEGERVDS